MQDTEPARHKLLIVANRLPITLEKDLEKSKKSSGGLVTAMEGMDDDRYEVMWIGWPGRDVPTDRQAEASQFLLERYMAAPVFLTADEQNLFYEGYSNSSLWPLLHYMPTRFKHEAKWWAAYRAVNQKFADAVLAHAGDGDTVWVQDYQLMLLPALLRAARPTLRIGFFLHTPFPSYEVFRYLPQRDELVGGLLGADLVGFHTYGYMRHYRSCVLRLLGLDAEFATIRTAGRTTQLGVYPIGINAQKFVDQLESPEHAARRDALARTHSDIVLVLSVERMDYTKGILHRLDAINAFLQERSADERDKVRFIFVGVPSREGVSDYQTLLEEVERQVGHLNGKYATLQNSPVLFIHGSVAFADLCAMYELADVCMVTPLIDGMNLVAKEFIACQRLSAEGGGCGVLVLSEFAGAADELHGATIVNPYDQESVVAALNEALAMPLAERRLRMKPMHERVMHHDAAAWAKEFLGDLAERSTAADVSRPIDEAEKILDDAVRGGKRVALFLDYDGTLREIERDPAAARPTDALHALLDRLSQQSNVDTTIVSGRIAAEMESWLGKYPFTLVTEHGAAMRLVGAGKWELLGTSLDLSWMDEIMLVMRHYNDSTPGTTVEVKSTGLVWHYRQADPEFGEWKAKVLMEELSTLAANLPVQVRHGRKIIEVGAADVSKANAVQRILSDKQAQTGQDYNVILCAGDDLTDESMLKVRGANVLTIKVGFAETKAIYQLPDPAAFRIMLMKCTEVR